MVTKEPPESSLDSEETLSAEEMPTQTAETALGRARVPSKIPETIGQYRILSKLGEGGMGVVFLAEQQHPKRKVALKVVRGGQFLDDTAVRMFQREADTLARLEHPNIGAIYESGRTADGQHFFAMELVQGETLDIHLEKRPEAVTPQELRERLELFRQMADAVHYAHQRGVIHRDLKPSNVIVTEQTAKEGSTVSTVRLPEVKILDFGLARITEGDMAAVTVLTEVGVIKGTLPYMSPEQARGNPEEIDLRSDVYALGVILYEMLTGERPYEVEKTSLIDAVRVICEAPPRPLGQAWKGVRKLDPDLETIIGKALEKDVERRYTSAAALSEDVGRYLTSQPILARPPSTTYLLKKLVARNRLATVFAGTVLILLCGFGLWMSVLWRQSELARQRADAETLRAEAGKLLALGQLELDSFPTVTVAYATKSLEMSDTLEGRELAVKALQAGPPLTALHATPERVQNLDFSPGGQWLATGGLERVMMRHESGGEPGEVGVFPLTGSPIGTLFGPGNVLVTSRGDSLVWRSPPDWGELRTTEWEPGFLMHAGPEGFLAVSPEGSGWRLAWWPFGQGERREVGFLDAGGVMDADQGGFWLAYCRDRRVFVRSLKDWERPPILLGEHTETVRDLSFRSDGQHIAAIDAAGEIRIWSVAGGSQKPVRTLRGDRVSSIIYDSAGTKLATHGKVDGNPLIRLWDLSAPQGARSLELKRTDQFFGMRLTFHPTLPWLVGANHDGAGFWPLATTYPWTLALHRSSVSDVVFTPDGKWLISASNRQIRAWPLEGQDDGASRILLERTLQFPDIAIQSSGKHIAVGTRDGLVLVVPLDGGSPRELAAFPAEVTEVAGSVVAFSQSGKRLAAVPRFGPPEGLTIRVWDLDSGETWELTPGPGNVPNLHFLDENRVVWSAGGRLGTEEGGGEKIFNLESGKVELLAENESQWHWITSSDSSFAISNRDAGDLGWELIRTDRRSREHRRFSKWGDATWALALGPGDELLATGGDDGLVRVGPVVDEPPHVLGGHPGPVRAVAISADGRWVASGGEDGTVRVWPMPDLSVAPMQVQPLDELLETLRSLTNLRVVEADSSTGWRVDVDPFPGWAEVPTW